MSLVETACKPIHECIHSWTEVFHYAINYSCVNDNCCPIDTCKFLLNISVVMPVIDNTLKFAKSSWNMPKMVYYMPKIVESLRKFLHPVSTDPHEICSRGIPNTMLLMPSGNGAIFWEKNNSWMQNFTQSPLLTFLLNSLGEFILNFKLMEHLN